MNLDAAAPRAYGAVDPTSPRAPGNPLGAGDTALLLERVRLLRATHRPVLLGLVGAPGSGKSTVTSWLAELLGPGCVVVPMDGFHLADVELARLGRNGRKGAWDTFDAAGLAALLARIRTSPPDGVYAPVFDRAIEAGVAGALLVPGDAQLVLVEGNYLLAEQGNWPDVTAQLDEVWFLDPPDELRRPRLLARHEAYGRTPSAASAWVETVDEPNADVVRAGLPRASLVLRERPHGEWDLTAKGI